MKSLIIGIAGVKGSGKDTVANMINYIFGVGLTNANYNQWITTKTKMQYTYADRIIHFADPMKDILSIMYNIPRKYFDNRKYKDELWYCVNNHKFTNDDIVRDKNLYRIINIDNLQNRTLNDYIKTENKFIYIRLRTLMQYFGTNICRNNLDENIWIKSAMEKIEAKAKARKICIVPDVRFSNEARAICLRDESLYGVVLKIIRGNNSNNGSYNHTSENIDFNCDYDVINDSSLMNLFYKVYQICIELNKL